MSQKVKYVNLTTHLTNVSNTVVTDGTVYDNNKVEHNSVGNFHARHFLFAYAMSCNKTTYIYLHIAN